MKPSHSRHLRDRWRQATLTRKKNETRKIKRETSRMKKLSEQSSMFSHNPQCCRLVWTKWSEQTDECVSRKQLFVKRSKRNGIPCEMGFRICIRALNPHKVSNRYESCATLLFKDETPNILASIHWLKNSALFFLNLQRLPIHWGLETDSR